MKLSNILENDLDEDGGADRDASTEAERQADVDLGAKADDDGEGVFAASSKNGLEGWGIFKL